ncbi:MAG: glycosyltransferase [Alphaproteobacteria bacterium]|nr:glycosyltransferase [Alphaproteobacteria bacterium]
MSAALVILVKGYPRLSETFIADELAALEARGLAFEIVALRRPTDRIAHPVHDAIAAPVRYLPEYLHEAPRRVAAGLAAAARLAGFSHAWRRFLEDLARDPTRNRVRRFGQAAVLAAELPAGTRHLHAHFLHTPTSVARYAAIMRGLTFSVSAHAKDIWTIPDWEAREKLAEARFVVTCTQDGARRLAALAPQARLERHYHGLALPDAPARPPRPPGAPLRIVSVGRAVPKKGYEDLLAALARLEPARAWSFAHIGGGPQLQRLKRQAERLGIAGRTSWLGAQARPAVLAALADADLFVLAAKTAADGDRDGLPNVLLEAQAMGLPVLATRHAAIPELVLDGETGLLVPPADPLALSQAIARLADDPALRARLAAAGRARVATAFRPEAGHERIAALLAEAIGAPGAREAA